jgi:DNA-binding MarR family transcriptional regulator
MAVKRAKAAAKTPPDPVAPRWLTAEERRAWLALSRTALRLPAALDRDLQRAAGLTFFEYMVLALLSEQPGRTLGMTELASILASSLSRLSHVARRLEMQGLVRREKGPGVGRSTNAVLTDEGYRRVEQTAPAHVEQVRHYVLDGLSKAELTAMASIGERITARIDGNSV